MKIARYLIYPALLLSLLPATALAETHQFGTNIISGQQVYRVSGSCGGAQGPPILRPYPSATIFLSYPKNSWATVVQANSDDLALEKGPLMTFMSGTLVNDKGTIYVLTDNDSCDRISYRKRGIPDIDTFISLGYAWGNVISEDISFMPDGNIISASDAHVSGTLVNDSGTIYYITQYGKIGITSMGEFNSKGFDLKDIVPANDKDRALPTDPYGWNGPLIP